jgi:hypothetical protein
VLLAVRDHKQTLLGRVLLLQLLTFALKGKPVATVLGLREDATRPFNQLPEVRVVQPFAAADEEQRLDGGERALDVLRGLVA